MKPFVNFLQLNTLYSLFYAQITVTSNQCEVVYLESLI